MYKMLPFSVKSGANSCDFQENVVYLQMNFHTSDSSEVATIYKNK